MGIFSYLNALRNSLSSGGNFSYIAQNIATIYSVVNDSTFGKRLSDEQKYFATALIDTALYISNGTLSIDELADAVSYSQTKRIVLPPFERYLNIFDFRENYELLCLTMQIESMIFHVDTNVSANQIINLVIQNEEEISLVINKTLSDGFNGKLYKKMYPSICSHLDDVDFQHIVLSYEE